MKLQQHETLSSHFAATRIAAAPQTYRFDAIEAANIIEQHQPHPHDQKVRYMPDEPGLVAPLVQQGFLKGAIIRPTAAFRQMLEDRADELNPAAWQKSGPAYMRPKNHVGAEYSKGTMLHPHLVAPEIRDLCKSEFSHMASYIEYRPSKLGKTWMVLHHKPRIEIGGVLPFLHTDDLNSHKTLFGAGLEWLAGDLTPEQIEKIERGRDNKSWAEQRDALPGLEDRIQSVERGELMIFKELYHMSSRFIPEQGQLALTLALHETPGRDF